MHNIFGHARLIAGLRGRDAAMRYSAVARMLPSLSPRLPNELRVHHDEKHHGVAYRHR